MTTQDACIVDACKEAWDGEFINGTKNSNNCSGFVKAVLGKLGIPIAKTANADAIVAAVGKDWSEIKSGVEAAQRASSGTLVLACLQGADHKPPRNNGHVAIVIAGKLYKEIYPLCWCGSLGAAKSQGDQSVGVVWGRVDRDSVRYFAYGIAACSATRV